MRIIIVHINERSLERSIEIAREQGEVVLVNKKPFSEALKVAFDIAKDWDWMTLIGGDQYLNPDAIKRIEELIKDIDDNVFRLSFRGWDHLYQMRRLMAPCVYRCSLLREAMTIDTSKKIRPESFIKDEMKRRGYDFKILPDHLAIHDKDQYYKDIYKKGYNSAIKSLPYIEGNDVRNMLRYSTDPDHAVFLEGINDGIRKEIRPIRDVLKMLNLKEKQ